MPFFYAYFLYNNIWLGGMKKCEYVIQDIIPMLRQMNPI